MSWPWSREADSSRKGWAGSCGAWEHPWAQGCLGALLAALLIALICKVRGSAEQEEHR